MNLFLLWYKGDNKLAQLDPVKTTIQTCSREELFTKILWMHTLIGQTSFTKNPFQWLKIPIKYSKSSLNIINSS